MWNLSVITRRQDWISLVLAILLFVSPWALGFLGEGRAAWNAWVFGAIIGLLALAALTGYREWEEWEEGIEFLLGIWVVVAPWVLGFVASVAALWVHVVLGILIIVASAWEFWQTRHRPHATA
jgi:hypothetical protein